MPKNRVTLVALGGLVAAVAAAYFLNRGNGAVAPAAESKAAEVKSAAAGKSPDKAAKGPPGGGAAPVEVVVLQPTRISEELQAVGSLRSNESAMLRPEVSGRIATIGFRDGQPVKRGQLLVALDSSLNQAEVAQARAELDLAISNLKRTEDLARKNFVSSSAQEQAASNVEVLAARLKLAEAR
ncbi:MAG: biotin/lipoyl-binding protein, partial [Burkholderiaceae bacterium]|nr:biotin/lipoyl-binding protein [Burkholderiaceae bacterium]